MYIGEANYGYEVIQVAKRYQINFNIPFEQALALAIGWAHYEAAFSSGHNWAGPR